MKRTPHQIQQDYLRSLNMAKKPEPFFSLKTLIGMIIAGILIFGCYAIGILAGGAIQALP